MSASSLKMLAEGATKSGDVQKATSYFVDPRAVQVEEGFNARPIDPDHVASLMVSYKAGKEFNAIIVRVENGSIILIDGHHRHAALSQMIAEGMDIKRTAAIEFKGNESERRMLMLRSAAGLSLTPLQQGAQYKLLIAMGHTVKEIAAGTGKSEPHVAQMVKLTETPASVQRMVAKKEVSADVALKAAKKHGKDAPAVLEKALAKSKEKGGKGKVTAAALGFSDVQRIKFIVTKATVAQLSVLAQTPRGTARSDYLDSLMGDK